MRVCIFVRVLWPGGVQSIAFGTAKSLSDLGHEVDLVFLRDSGRGIHPWSYMHPYRILNDSNVNQRMLHTLLSTITRIYAPERGSDATVDIDLIKKFELSRHSYDVVIYFDQLSAYFANLGSRLHGDKYIVDIMESYYKWKRLIPRYIERRALKSASAILTIGNKDLEILQLKGYENIHLIYPGTIPLQECPGFSQRDDMVISITMWDEGRHPEVFISIAQRMKNGKVYLIGDWTKHEYFEQFKKRVESLGLSDRLLITGRISRTELERFLRSAKIMIRFGYNEFGPGMGSLEALSYGIPLIINKEIGIYDIITTMGIDPSVVVCEHDYEKIVNEIEKLMNDEKEWQKKSEIAITLAQQLAWNKYGKKLEKVLYGVVELNRQESNR